MAETFELSARARADQGKGASRRLRRAGQLPGVVYGGSKEPVPIVLDHNHVWVHLQHEAFHSHILTLNLDGGNEEVVLRDVQWHPHEPRVLHIDLQRISATEKIHMKVPLHFVGEDVAPGLKMGGVITHTVTDVEIECLPRDLPEFIAVDVSTMEMDQIFHYSDLRLPNGVELLTHGQESDLPIASIHMPRVVAEVEEEPEAGESAGETRPEADED